MEKYRILIFVTLMFSGLFISCSIELYNPFTSTYNKPTPKPTVEPEQTPESTPAPDEIPPVPGNSGILTITDQQQTSLCLNWIEAKDNVTLQNNLLYKVVISNSPNINTTTDAETNGTIVTNWTAGINNATASLLDPATVYYLNVLVKDETGEMAVYSMLDTATLLPSETTALVAYYPFNGNAQDESINANHLSVFEAVLTSNREIQDNKAYSFDPNTGGIDYLYVNNPPEMDFTGKLTISVWVYINDTINDQKIIGKADPPDAGYVMGIEDGDIKHEIWDSATVRFVLDNGPVTQDTWSHIVLTWKTGGYMRSYINGNLTREINASTLPIGTVSGYFRIGCSPWDTNFAGFDGKIDDIRMYNEELSSTDIQALYHYPVD